MITYNITYSLVLPCCLLLPEPVLSILGLDLAVCLFWASGEAQMYSKDPLKGQGHPGLIRLPLLSLYSLRSPWHLETCSR